MAETWSPATKAVRVESVDGVAVVRLSRPKLLNALDLPTLRDLTGAISWYGTEGRAAGLVLTGEGKAFSAGDDLKASADVEREAFVEVIEAFQDVTRAILRTEVPVIAGVNGIAVGGAAEIACACDVRVGCPESDFMFPENFLGLTITNGSSVTLPGLVGRRAMGLILLGQRLPAGQALSLGLIDVMVDEPSEVEPEARRIAAALGEEGRATRLHLSMLRPPPQGMEHSLQRERAAALEAWDQGWVQAGIKRFLEERYRGTS
ncbi:MAG: enoyl-CoA hydratase/isomerase family protein [Actinomycetota bacterium]